MTFKRTARVGDLLQREIGAILQRQAKDPHLDFVTVTRVDLSVDLRVAKVYVSILGEKEERDRTLQALERAKSFIRREIGRRVRLRHTPELVFKWDPSALYAVRINQMLAQLRERETRPEQE